MNSLRHFIALSFEWKYFFFFFNFRLFCCCCYFFYSKFEQNLRQWMRSHQLIVLSFGEWFQLIDGTWEVRIAIDNKMKWNEFDERQMKSKICLVFFFFSFYFSCVFCRSSSSFTFDISVPESCVRCHEHWSFSFSLNHFSFCRWIILLVFLRHIVECRFLLKSKALKMFFSLSTKKGNLIVFYRACLMTLI